MMKTGKTIVLCLLFCWMLCGRVQANSGMEHILEEIDLREIESFLEEENISDTISFRDIVQDFLKADFKNCREKFLMYIKENWNKEWNENKRIWKELCMLSLLSVVVSSFCELLKDRQLSNTGFYMIYLFLMLIMLKLFVMGCDIAMESIEKIIGFMKVLIPSFLLALGLSGKIVTGAIYYEWGLFLTNIVQLLIRYFVLPGVKLFFLFTLAEGLMRENLISKITDLVKDILQWGLKGMIAVVTGIQIIQNMIGPAADYAKRKVLFGSVSAIPGIGDAVNSVSDVVIGSAVLIRNSIGAAAMIILLFLCIIPGIKIGMLFLGCRLSAVLLQPVCEERYIETILKSSESMLLLLKMVTCSFFIFWLSIAIICVGLGG